MHFGGHGYSHILMNVVPKMIQRGISKEEIDQILVATPRRWLTLWSKTTKVWWCPRNQAYRSRAKARYSYTSSNDGKRVNVNKTPWIGKFWCFFFNVDFILIFISSVLDPWWSFKMCGGIGLIDWLVSWYVSMACQLSRRWHVEMRLDLLAFHFGNSFPAHWLHIK